MPCSRSTANVAVARGSASMSASRASSASRSPSASARKRSMLRLSRRSLLLTGAAAAVAASSKVVRAQVAGQGWDVAVVGAGVFGAWTAKKLQDAGKRVLLLDAWGPAHARASSGGESRLTRGSYG